MAPSRSHRRVTTRTDIFAFGVVAYEALTGKRPFQGDSITAIIYRIVHEPAPPPRSLNDDLPAHHDDVFRRALAKDPANRFPSALSFIAALSGEEMIVPTDLLEPIGGKSATDRSGELTTHLLKRRRDGTLGDDEAPRRRWLPWTVAAAALIAVGAEVVMLRGSGPLPPVVTRRVASLPEGLRIETRPAGASVWMDGRPAGTSPLSIPDLRPGPHQVRVEQEGFAPAELTFDVSEGVAPPPLRFVAARGWAPVEIHSGDAATVTVRRATGLTPIEVRWVGRCEIRLTEGFVPAIGGEAQPECAGIQAR